MDTEEGKEISKNLSERGYFWTYLSPRMDKWVLKGPGFRQEGSYSETRAKALEILKN